MIRNGIIPSTCYDSCEWLEPTAHLHPSARPPTTTHTHVYLTYTSGLGGFPLPPTIGLQTSYPGGVLNSLVLARRTASKHSSRPHSLPNVTADITQVCPLEHTHTRLIYIAIYTCKTRPKVWSPIYIHKTFPSGITAHRRLQNSTGKIKTCREYKKARPYKTPEGLRFTM